MKKTSLSFYSIKRYTLLLLVLTAAFHAAAYDFLVNGIYYNKTSDNTVEVTYRNLTEADYTGSIVIPDEVEYDGTTFSVTSIGVSAFAYSYTLNSVTIGNAITSIDMYAFLNCNDLTSVTMPESVASIGSSAFAYCYALPSIYIPASVTEIGNDAFNSCKSLKSLTIDDGEATLSLGSGVFEKCPLETLYLGRNLSYNSSPGYGYSPFYEMTKLESVVIGTSITSIGDSAFRKCTSLSSLEIGNSVNSIGEDAFSDCSSLTTLEIPNSVTSIGSYAFFDCFNLTSVIIPDAVISIGSHAFGYCYKLSSVTFGNSVTSIGESAFYRCETLRIITSNATVPPQIESSTFDPDTKEYAIVHVPVGAIDEYRNSWSEFSHFIEPGYHEQEFTVSSPGDLLNMVSLNEVAQLTCVKISGEINGTDLLTLNKMTNLIKLDLTDATIVSGGLPYYEADNEIWGTEDNILSENWAYNLDVLSEVKLPTTLRVIGDNAFESKMCLTNITIPDGVISIGSSAFYNCSALNTVIIGKATVGSDAFYGCTSLSAVTIGDGVRSINDGAFWGCSALTAITIPASVTNIGNNTFSRCNALKSITFEDGETTLSLGSNTSSLTSRGNLFHDCPLEEVYLGRNLSYQTYEVNGYSPFYYQKKLKSVVIGNAVTKIGDSAFRNCSALTSIILPAAVTEIGWWAFQFCSSIKSVTLGSSVNSIGWYAFAYCSSLSSIAIPDPVTEIGESTFLSCTSLNSVTIGKAVTSIGSKAFYDCPSLTTLEIPNSVTSIGSYAFSYCSSLTSIAIPDGVTALNSHTFAECSSLATVDFGSSISSIGTDCFSNCLALTEIAVPYPVQEIGTSAFYGCAHLSKVTLPGSLRNIYDGVFSGCNELTEINVINPIPAVIQSSTFTNSNYSNITLNVPDGSKAIYWIHPYWGKFENIATWTAGSNKEFVQDDVTFYVTSEADRTVEIRGSMLTASRSASEGSTMIIPATVEFEETSYRVAGVANNGFENATMSAIVLPKTLCYIGLEAFKGCDHLTDITCEALLPPTVNSNSFDEATYSSTTLRVPEEAVSAYKNNDVWSRFNVVAMGVTGITVNPQEWEGIVGESFTITAIVAPETATDKSLTWSSCNEAVATVDQDGKVTAVALGDAVITVQTSNPEVSATCAVKVVPTAVSAITIDPEEWEGEVGESFTITATVSPETATDKSLTWTSSNEAVATVDQDGKVTAVTVGEALITVKTSNPDVSAECEVTVVPTLVTSIVLNPEEWSGAAGESFTIIATVTPENATDKTLDWRSSDISIADVDANGTVTVLRNGMCTITASTTDGSNLSADCVVTGLSGIDVLFVNDDEKADIYNTKGALLLKDASSADARLLAPGAYILQFPSRTVKAVIR